MTLDREEYCIHCGNPTGRAGNFHDPLFLDLTGVTVEINEKIDKENYGPLCDECHDTLSNHN